VPYHFERPPRESSQRSVAVMMMTAALKPLTKNVANLQGRDIGQAGHVTPVFNVNDGIEHFRPQECWRCRIRTGNGRPFSVVLPSINGVHSLNTQRGGSTETPSKVVITSNE